MSKKKMTLHEKAVRLSEGGAVEIDSLVVMAKRVGDDTMPCDICEMDCLCHQEMADLCSELDSYDRFMHILYLPQP